MNCCSLSLRFASLVLVFAIAASVTLGIPRALALENPYAAVMISYEPGAGVIDYDNPLAALGQPTRFTGVGSFPAVVSPFNPPWGLDDIVSIGPGGHLVVKFDFPVTDHPDNPFGIDLIVFGNTGFIDLMWPSAVVGGVFGNDGGIVEVSADGTTWHVVRDAEADGLFPSVGYLDSGPYDLRPGAVESDFRKPVDPTLALKDFLGLGFSAVLDLYDGSGGGAGIDIGATGLSQISYVRVSNPVDAFASVEIDGFAKVRPTIHGDLNGDGVVNIFDLLVVLASWGPCPEPPAGCPADLDESGVVNVFDLLIVLQNWG